MRLLFQFRTLGIGSYATCRPPLAFWIGLGVPLVIALIGYWQWHRGDIWTTATPTSYPHASGFGLHFSLKPLAVSGMVLGGAAVVAFGAALLAMRYAAARAMQSRDALLLAFEASRRWLPGFMMLQTLLVFAGLICVLSFEAIDALEQSRVVRGKEPLIVGASLAALALLWLAARITWSVLRFVRQHPVEEPIVVLGQTLSRAQAPRLWEFVDDVAHRVGASPPDTVIAGLNEGFFVTEHPVALANGQKVPEGRVLHLPLPYMAFLGRAQVAAVIAHELAHFVGEDTAYSLNFVPIHRALAASVLAITNEHDEEDAGWRRLLSAPASLYGKWFLASIDSATHHWMRERELAADKFGCRIGGAEPAALALLRIAVLHEIVDEALISNRQAQQQQREGVLPMLRRLAAERGLADPREHLDNRQPYPLDTHPTLSQRLEAIGVAISPRIIEQVRDARDSGLLVELGLELKRTTHRRVP